MMTVPLWGERAALVDQITAITPGYRALWVSDDYTSLVLARPDGLFAVVLSDKPVAPTEHLKKARDVLEENGFKPTDLKVVNP